MTEFEEIWQFIERKMKVPIPPFIKYVLKFCGYENCHTISTIEEHDFAYFETEVRKGGIIEFFNGEVEKEDLFKGSTKSIENFEIIRGHRKLLMAAVNVVKEKIENARENGIDVILVPSPKRKQVKKIEKATVGNDVRMVAPRKKQKFSTFELLNEPTESKEEDDQVDPEIDPHVKHHKQVLYIKALSCLKNHNAKTYDEKLQFYKEKLTEDSMHLARKAPDSHQYTAKIKCPDCGDVLTVFHKVSSTNFGSWNVFNFERHLASVHKLPNVPAVKHIDGTGKMEIKTESKEEEDEEEIDALTGNDQKDFILVVVPPLPTSRDVDDDIEIDNVMVQDFSTCGSMTSLDIGYTAGETQNKITENLVEITGSALMFRNGAETQDECWDETKRIITVNTCPFDSVFAVYASRFSEDGDYREFLDVCTLFYQCQFTELVDLYCQTTEATPNLDALQITSAWKILNRNRNIILKNVFSSECFESNMKKDDKITFINCKSGLGDFFAQLSIPNGMISSALETSTCRTCKLTKTKIFPFVPLDVIGLDLSNIQEAIDSKGKKNRICCNCKKKIAIERVFNKMLAIHVEPNFHIKNGKKFNLANLCPAIVIDKESGGIHYKLYGAISYNPSVSHFTAFVKKNNTWSEHDDLKKTEIKTDESMQILPFMVFYSTDNNCKSFKRNFFKNKIASNEREFKLDTEPEPVGAKIRNGRTSENTVNVNKINKSQSNASSKDWQRNRESNWKY